MWAPRPCGVCGAGGVAKYRSLRCAATYCSVPCCRTHKERYRLEPKREQERTMARQVVPGGPSHAGQHTDSLQSVEDILTEDDEQDCFLLQKLKLLGESEEFRDLLLNLHLRQLLLTVDQAEDKSSLNKKYVQEPLLVEFVDC